MTGETACADASISGVETTGFSGAAATGNDGGGSGAGTPASQVNTFGVAESGASNVNTFGNGAGGVSKFNTFDAGRGIRGKVNELDTGLSGANVSELDAVGANVNELEVGRGSAKLATFPNAARGTSLLDCPRAMVTARNANNTSIDRRISAEVGCAVRKICLIDPCCLRQSE